MKTSRKLTTIRNNEGRNGPQSLSRNLITAQCSQSVPWMNGYDFAYVSKLEKKKHTDIFSNLQRFIYEFCGETDINKAIKYILRRKVRKSEQIRTDMFPILYKRLETHILNIRN